MKNCRYEEYKRNKKKMAIFARLL